MACKRSAVRSRLPPPKNAELNRACQSLTDKAAVCGLCFARSRTSNSRSSRMPNFHLEHPRSPARGLPASPADRAPPSLPHERHLRARSQAFPHAQHARPASGRLARAAAGAGRQAQLVARRLAHELHCTLIVLGAAAALLGPHIEHGAFGAVALCRGSIQASISQDMSCLRVSIRCLLVGCDAA